MLSPVLIIHYMRFKGQCQEQKRAVLKIFPEPPNVYQLPKDLEP